MPDIDHIWGNDISSGPTGDLAVVDGTQLGIERILRRLMTRGKVLAAVNTAPVSGEYIASPTYGGGIPLRIGEILNDQQIIAVIRYQMGKEAIVAKNPAPVITLVPIFDGVNVLIQYNDSVTGEQKTLSFDVNQ